MNFSRQYQLDTGQTTPPQGSAPTLDVDPQWAWAEFQPDDQRPWNLALAGHLYRRAGFGRIGSSSRVPCPTAHARRLNHWCVRRRTCRPTKKPGTGMKRQPDVRPASSRCAPGGCVA